jgi:hypothetical protein
VNWVAKKNEKRQFVDKVEFRLGNNAIGEFGYWNCRWDVAHPKKMKPNCGTYTIINADTINSWVAGELKACPQILICSVKVLSRRNEYEEYDTRSINFQIDLDAL